MRSMLVWCVLSSVAFAAQPARALIWAGGATAEAGVEAFKSFEARKAELAEYVALAPGFPKLVESKTVTGLKPGFHVVLLGLCGEDVADERLAVLKLVEEKVYARRVQVEVEALGCPSLSGGWRLEASRTAGPMTTFVVGQPRGRFVVLSVVNNAQGELSDFNALEELCEGIVQREGPTLSGDAESVVMEVKCSAPGCTTPDETTERVRFELKKQRIKVSRKSVFRKGVCD